MVQLLVGRCGEFMLGWEVNPQLEAVRVGEVGAMNWHLEDRGLGLRIAREIFREMDLGVDDWRV